MGSVPSPFFLHRCPHRAPTPHVASKGSSVMEERPLLFFTGGMAFGPTMMPAAWSWKLTLLVLFLLQSASSTIFWGRARAPLVHCKATSPSFQANAAARTPAPPPPAAARRDGEGGRRFLGRLKNETRHMIDETKHLIEVTEHGIEEEVAAIGRFVQREKIALEHLEHRVEDLWRRSKVARVLCFKGVAGSALLFTGAHFSRCVVLAHTLRVTGWPILQRAAHEIAHAYREARTVVQREVGHLVSPGEILQAVRYEIQSMQRLIKESHEAAEAGRLSREQSAAIIRQAQVDVTRLNREAWVLNQAVDSISAITAAVDFHKLRDVTKSIYTGALAVFASANSITVRNLSLAFDLGAIIGNNINCLAQSLLDHYHAKEVTAHLPPETRRLLSVSIGCAGAVKGLLIVQAVVPNMSLRISSAALGAAWVAEMLADLIDPHLEYHGVGHYRIEGRAPFVPLHLGLTLLGYRFQKRYRDERFPRLIQQALTPLTVMEKQLKKYDKVFQLGKKK